MNRKDKGDKAERARQTYWESKGAVVFPVSPNYAGVDLIVFGRGDWAFADIILSEVKGQRAKLYGKTLKDAQDKLWRAAAAVRRVTGRQVAVELVHVHPDTGEQEVLT